MNCDITLQFWLVLSLVLNCLENCQYLGGIISVTYYFLTTTYILNPPDGAIGIFHLHNPSGRTVALGSTRPITEMSTAMRRITTFRSTTDRICDGGPIRL